MAFNFTNLKIILINALINLTTEQFDKTPLIEAVTKPSIYDESL